MNDPGVQNVLAQIKSNAARVVETMDEITAFEFGYDDESLEFLDGYLNRQHRNGDPDLHEQLASTMGCFVGECLVVMHGGQWVLDLDNGWMVAVGSIKANPFAKTIKLLCNGLAGGDSVRSFVHTAPTLAERAEEQGKNQD